MFKIVNSLQQQSVHLYIRGIAWKVYDLSSPPTNLLKSLEYSMFIKEFDRILSPMIAELSILEVEARRRKNGYIVKEQLKKINDFIELTENELTLRALES
jgi:hypothetical protein